MVGNDSTMCCGGRGLHRGPQHSEELSPDGESALNDAFWGPDSKAVCVCGLEGEWMNKLARVLQTNLKGTEKKNEGLDSGERFANPRDTASSRNRKCTSWR